jgi:hypothetical protein
MSLRKGRMILPDEVIGTCVVNWIARGTLYAREMLSALRDELLARDLRRGLEDDVGLSRARPSPRPRFRRPRRVRLPPIGPHPNGTPQISLCYIGNIDVIYNLRDVDKLEMMVKRPLDVLDVNRPEKNWLPFIYDNMIHFIYGYPNIRYIDLEKETIKEDLGFLETKLKCENKNEINLDRFRGSGGPIKFVHNKIAGYLTIVHEVSWCDDNSRIYTHRFVFFGPKFEITHISLPWYFENHGLEFCRSMAIADSETILITCGLSDNEAWIYSIDIKTIKLFDLDYFTL